MHEAKLKDLQKQALFNKPFSHRGKEFEYIQSARS